MLAEQGRSERAMSTSELDIIFFLESFCCTVVIGRTLTGTEADPDIYAQYLHISWQWPVDAQLRYNPPLPLATTKIALLHILARKGTIGILGSLGKSIATFCSGPILTTSGYAISN